MKLSALSISVNGGFDELVLDVFNNIINIDRTVDLSVFTSSFNLANLKKYFSVLPLYEAKYCKSSFLVWDLISLDLVSQLPCAQKIIYLHNTQLPWVENTSVEYVVWEKLFNNSKTQIITTNNNIAEIIRLTWGDCKLLENLNSESLYEVLRADE